MKVFVVITLLCCVLFPLKLLAASGNGEKPVSAQECEEGVDGADDMNFVDNIIECSEEAVIIYDSSSRKQFMMRKDLPLKTFENQQRDGENGDTAETPVHLPGTRFVIRAVYKLSAPQEALAPLYQQLATYCPLGWELDRQWSRPAAEDYYMHFEFSCADTEQ